MKLDRVPIALGAVFCAALAFFMLQSAPLRADELARAIARERRIVFRLGVVTSIAVLLVLLLHGALLSRRRAVRVRGGR